VTASPRAEAGAYRRFLAASPPASAASAASGPSGPSGSSGSSGATASVPRADASRLLAGTAGGRRQAAALARAGLPVYYPRLIAPGSEYCASSTGDCATAPNPAQAYDGSYSRSYTLAGHAAYRMTLVIDPALGEYYGVEGTTWMHPPILARPTRTQVVHGRTLLEYAGPTGGRLAVVAFRTPHAVYWVTNTLTDAIPSGQLLAIAASLEPPIGVSP
jgi:hypothetical protein